MTRFHSSPIRWAFAWLITLPVLLGQIQTLSQDSVYQQDFQSTPSGEVPDDFLLLGGRFATGELEDNRFLELPGTPLDNHGAVFGPDNEGPLELSARIYSERRGRLYPSFGLGLHGLGGYILKVSPGKKSLELFKGREALKEVDYKWDSGTWTHLRLQVVPDGETSWTIQAKAWQETKAEPDNWMISITTSEPPAQGQASLWGQPFSSKAIRYDDLLIQRPGATNASNTLPFELGLQTWTLRNLNFEQVVDFAKEHGIQKLQVIGNHINPHADCEEIKARKAVLDANGLQAYTFGVAGTSTDHAYNRRLFEFAKFMGIQLIVVEPGDFAIFDSLEKLVKEFDIKVAIHNHGLTSLYGNPLVVRKIIQHRDARIGVCMDVGWITAAGFDAAKVFKAYDGRVYDIHLKDKKVEIANNRLVGISAGIGEGDANIEGLMDVLKETGYPGVLAIETDSPIFARQPAEFVSKAKAYYESLTQP